jgi:hypothetical protein
MNNKYTNIIYLNDFKQHLFKIIKDKKGGIGSILLPTEFISFMKDKNIELIQLTEQCDEHLLKNGSTLVILTKSNEDPNSIKDPNSIEIEIELDKKKFDINKKDKLFFIEKCESDQKKCHDETCQSKVLECEKLNKEKTSCQEKNDETVRLHAQIPYGSFPGGKKSRRKRQNRKTKRKRRRSNK